MEGPINWKIVRHPMNWITLALMVLIPLVAVRIVLGNPPKAGQESQQ